ncbi:hypothetical protein ACIRPH_18960 [Nocardiopsis sp. NPDC101807]|uniref:hypothetical protein n=1 Tax=Nocardiopsis sp. NPDC101807 TaxID=3364339 RepID=UPI0038090CE4
MNTRTRADRRLERFVRDRVGEADRGRPDPCTRSHLALLATVDALREEASEEEDRNWAETLADVFGGWFSGDDPAEEDPAADPGVFGDDPERTAAAVAVRVLACVALAYEDHPAFDPEWRRLLPDRARRGGGGRRP